MTEDTINKVFRKSADKYKDRLAIEKKRNNIWEKATWSEYYERARAAGLGMYSLGIKKGDKVSLLSENRLEWLYTDMGALGIGGSIIPIYQTLTKEEVEYLVDNSDSKIIVVEDRVQLEKAEYAIEKCPKLEKIIVINEEEIEKKTSSIISYNDLMEMGREKHSQDKNLYEKLSEEIEPDDLATIVYTSGTTGLPKGAMITHKNIMAVIQALDAVSPRYAYDTDQTVPFLPLSHVFERIAGHFNGIHVGITASYAESIDTLLQDFQERRPTVILAVPRVCEKVYQKIIGQVQEQSKFKQKIFYWGQKIGSRISELREAKKPAPLILKIKYKIAYNMIFKKLQGALGGRVRWMTASGAPTPVEIIRFFNAAGIMVIEGYGMTECCAPATMSNIADYKIGTVGRPLPGVDIRIADDGEILIKGDNVIPGYWKMQEETENSFTKDGYLMSGDIGVFDDNGFLMITDRKKDLIITAAGKNVAPQKIENLFKSDPLFLQFTVVGDRRKYLSALCNVNMEQAERIAREKDIAYEKPEEILENDIFLEIVEEHIQKQNAKLARYETIKKFRIVKNEFSQATGELTPSLKVKRGVVQKMYKDIIDTMY